MKKIIPLILAGGSGTRLWPLSQVNKPKQYQLVLNNQMLLTQTLSRCQNKIFNKPIISTNISHKPFIDEIDVSLYDQVIYESIGKNTAASIIISCFINKDPDSYILVMPSDHYIPNLNYFHDTIQSSFQSIDEFNIIIFGITPRHASSQYGYIKTTSDSGLSIVKSFHEKPDQDTADKMFGSKDYLWNSGMFLFKTSKLLKIVKNINPELFNNLYKISQEIKYEAKFSRIISKSWEDLDNLSFDVAVLENIKNIGCYKYKKYWSDLGDWKSIADNSASDLLIESKNSFVKSYDRNHEVIGVGLRDIVCVVANQKTLCIEKSRLNDIKNILSDHKIFSSTNIRKIHKPWGWYESLLKLPNYQIKLLNVNPNGVLSLQSHKQRAEHWIVVEGSAQVQKNNDIYTLTRNQSTFLDKEDKHKLWNKGSKPLQLIEVQIGDYLEEDDITRFDDTYDGL